MSIPRLGALAERLYRVRIWLEKMHLVNIVTRFVRIDRRPHQIFDWYAAPIATHHTYPEVLGWYREMGAEVVATRDRPPATTPLQHARKVAAIAARALVRFPNMVTVRGILRR